MGLPPPAEGMPYYTKAGEAIVSGSYAVVKNAREKGWKWWPVVVFTRWEDVWDKPAKELTPEDDNHVIVFYVEAWGVTKKSQYEIVNIKQIWHEDGISYGKMLRHVEEDDMKRDLAQAIHNREVNREEGEPSKDMKAVKEIYELFKMKYEDPAEVRAALKRGAESGEVQYEKGPQPSASAATGAPRADAKRKRSATAGSSKKKGRGSASSGRRQSSRVEQSDSDEDSDTDVEPDACKKTQTSRISNRSIGKKAQSEASSPMLTRSASTLNGPRGAPSTATEAAIGMDIDDNDEQDDAFAFGDDRRFSFVNSLSGSRKPTAPPAARESISDKPKPSTPTPTAQGQREHSAMPGARTKTRKDTTPPAGAMPPPQHRLLRPLPSDRRTKPPTGDAVGRRADEATPPQGDGDVETTAPSIAAPMIAKGTRAFADRPSAPLANAIPRTTASPEAPSISSVDASHETQRGGSAADRSSGQGDHGKQNEASISLKEGKEGQKKEAGQEVEEQAKKEEVEEEQEGEEDDLCIITEVRPPTVAGAAATKTAATVPPKEETSGGAAFKLDPDLLEVVKCLEPEAFARLRLGHAQYKAVWRTLVQMRSGTFNANTQAMTDFLLTNKVPADIASIMKDPSQIELTLECAAWALGG